MNRRRLALVALFGSALGVARAQAPVAPPAALQVTGVSYPLGVQVAGSPLQLNGAGTRYKFIIKVYTAGLYLTAKAGTPEAVTAAPGPKRLHVVMLREIDANELGKLFTRGMQDNAPREEFAKSIPGTIRMGEIFAAKKKLVAGENFGVEWVPGVGAQVLVNGKPMSDPIKEPEFFNGLLRIWLGKSPADSALKESLLGRPPQQRSFSSEGSPRFQCNK